MFKELLKEVIFRQKSLGRTLLNMSLRGIEVDSPGIDLGSKTNAASYYRFLHLKDPESWVYSDLDPLDENVIKIDLEQKFPCDDQSQKSLLLFNVLEHLYDTRHCLKECYRVLEVGGRLIGSVPFLIPIHRDPEDYFRFSDAALKRLFEEAGFANCEIEAISYGPVSSACLSFIPVFKYRIIKSFLTLTSLLTDKLIHSIFGRQYLLDPSRYPLHYRFIATKA